MEARGARAQVRLHKAPLVAMASSESKLTLQISRSRPDGTLQYKPALLLAERLGESGLALLPEFADVECAYSMFPTELFATLPWLLACCSVCLAQLLCSIICISCKYPVFPAQ